MERRLVFRSYHSNPGTCRYHSSGLPDSFFRRMTVQLGGRAMARDGGPVCVCVINLKGGVGKSTISALLARRAFTHRNLDVLAIDLDPQANLSQAFMHSDYNAYIKQGRPSIVELFNGYRPPSGQRRNVGQLLPPSVVVTIGQLPNRSLHLIPSCFDFSDNLISAVRPDPRVLAQFLADNFQDKGLIIIDCAPT